MGLLRNDEAGNKLKNEIISCNFFSVLCKVAALLQSLNEFCFCKAHLAQMLSKEAGYVIIIKPDQRTGMKMRPGLTHNGC